ncbi:MAG: type I-B CRISPR-associated protein Cas8b1/Cst1 [Firmicutes bacterium HGW-Firmicutes-12]|nr:MAG: type I-B CRISPR-associated protein Cas8b1/Cst1 [Firmicutes bacterium HGW-Firmicutes-12]
MSNETIRITLGDWQWNAAMIGFINIVGKDNVSFVGTDAIEFSSKVLDDFENKYFSYLINTYEKTLSWYKIVGYKNKLSAYESNFESFDLKDLKDLNKYIKDVKRYIKSNSYKSSYELINVDIDMLSLERQLVNIKEPKIHQFEADRIRVITEVEQALTVLWQVINYCENPGGKRYIRAKNVIYTLIKNAWNGVSFLNAQTKEKDMYIDYKKYFVEEVFDYLKADKTKCKYTCFVCDAPIKDMKNDLSFLNVTGFDVARKSSHVWNFQNDIAICPVCKLIYSCLPAGMMYIYDRGLYVNANIQLRDAMEINYRIKNDILRSHEGGIRSVYKSLVSTFNQQENDAAKYELADVQIVRYENESYRFNILSRVMLEIIVECKEELNSLINTAYNENGINMQIYDEVIGRVFNNQNLFTLIHKLLYYKVSDPSKCYFNGEHVRNLLKINQQIYSHLGGMKVEKSWEQQNDIVRNAKGAGYYLRQRYIDKGSDNKLTGICYRLLNALKTSKSDMFMDVVLNCYLYVNMQVPKVITDVLGEDKSFNTMGYAFIAGMIDGQGPKENTRQKVDKGEGK